MMSAHEIADAVVFLPAAKVGGYMTADPVVVVSGMGVRDLARVMLDGHIHRVGVVDDRNRLVGLVSSTDILAAVAYADARQ